MLTLTAQLHWLSGEETAVCELLWGVLIKSSNLEG